MTDSIATKVAVRFQAGGDVFTVKVRFSSTGKSTEYAISEILSDGFEGQPIGRSRGKELVRYGALDYVRILEEGDS